MNEKYLQFLNKIESDKVSDINDRVLILDGTNSYLRIWSSVPFMAENGEHAGGLVGFLRSIGSNIRDYNPSRCIIVFDGKGGSHRRRKIYPEYKQQRAGKYNIRREEFASYEDERTSQQRQLIRIMDYLDVFPIQVICLNDIEADDAIAYMVQSYFSTNNVRIVSTDRDFLQSVSDRVEVYSPVKKKLYGPEVLRDEFGFHPNNYLLYRVITGDTADNINGIKGIGLKTLLKSYPELIDSELNLSELVELSARSNKKIDDSIRENVDILDRNYKLMQLNDVDISGMSKMDMIDILNRPLPKITPALFKKMLIEDYIGAAFKYPDDWVKNTFSRLNYFAGQ